MSGYALRRAMTLIPMLFGVSVISFAVVRLAPGDPITTMLGAENYTPELAERLRHEIGLDRPIPVQYALWLVRAVQGDLGNSIVSHAPVMRLILQGLPITIALALAAMLVAIGVSVPLGIVSAMRKDSPVDNASRVLSMVGVSMPVFWLGLLLLFFFALSLGVLPPGGDIRRFGWQAIILPALALGAADAALLTRLLRSGLIEVLQQDFVRTARAKGLSSRTIAYRHALKNALLPVITIAGLQFATLLAGAVLTETIFDMHGLGQLLIYSFSQRDYPVVEGCILVMTLLAVSVNFVVDLLYGVLDPRVSLS